MKSIASYFVATFLVFATSCSIVDPSSNTDSADRMVAGKPGSGVITVNTAAHNQTIRGFGGATVWNGALTDEDCDKLFTTLGLSICRIRISPDGDWADDISNAQKAYARGASVFSSTWSPPAWMKDNNSTVSGYLLPEHYGDYTEWINSFISALEQNGVPLYAASVQNEPNINVSYESCTWTAEQMRDFVAGYAGGITTKVIMPETFNFLSTFGDVTLNDPAGSANTDICAFHWYGANRFRLWTTAFNQGKDIWMTEYYDDDQSLSAALATAEDILSFLTIDQCNAYVWWYVKTPSCNLITETGINPRGYVLGQFAKFVRPGYVRVDVEGSGNAVAFVNGESVVTVYVNSKRSAVSPVFAVSGTAVTSVTPYITDAEHAMESLSPISVTNGTFSATIPAYSIVTFVSN